MLRAQGATVGDVAVQEIEVFLKDTEEYLNRLSSKVSDTKLQQQTSEAIAAAMSEARAQGLTEEEVQVSSGFRV